MNIPYLVIATTARLEPSFYANDNMHIPEYRKTAWPTVRELMSLYSLTSQFETTPQVIKEAKKPNGIYQPGFGEYHIRQVNKMMSDNMRADKFTMSNIKFYLVPIDAVPTQEAYAMIDEFALSMCVADLQHVMAFGFCHINMQHDSLEMYRPLTANRNEPKETDGYVAASVGDIIRVNYSQSVSRIDDGWDHHKSVPKYFLVTKKLTSSIKVKELYNYVDTNTHDIAEHEETLKRKVVNHQVYWDKFYSRYSFQDQWSNAEIV